MLLVCHAKSQKSADILTSPADKSNWHTHQVVRLHIPWHIHQTCRLDNKCNCDSLSLSCRGCGSTTACMDRVSIRMLRVTIGQGSFSMAVDLVSPVCYDMIFAHEGTTLAVPSGPAQGIVFLCQCADSQCADSRAAGLETCQVP